MAISLSNFGWKNKKEGIRVKTPTVLQMEAVECGAAALGSVLSYYRTYVPLEELRVACGVSRDGSKASNILHAARSYGLEAKGFRLEPTSLYNLQMPIIVHWNFNHFLVVEGFKGDVVYLNDPASGPRTVSLDEFDESFTGIVLTFNKGENYKPQGKKPNTLKILRQRLVGSEVAVTFVVLASLALVIPGLLLPAFTRVFVDYYLVNGRQEWIFPLLGGMVFTAIVRSCLTWLQQYYLLRLETKLSLLSASQFFWHILQLPVEFFTQRSAGDINSRIGQNDRVAQLLSGELATSLMNVILIFFYAVLMFRYSVPLTILGICFAALNFVMLQRVSRFRKDINLRLIKDQGKLAAATFSSLQQIETLKSTGAEGDAFSSWAGYQANANNAQQQFGSTNQILTVLPGMLAQLCNIFILALGSWLVIQGQMTVGTLVAFQTLMASFLAPVNQMVQVGGQLQEVNGTIQRLDDVLKYETDPQVTLTAEAPQTAVPHAKLSGRLQIRDLTFGYSKLAAPLIEGFNLDIEPGMRVALVGGSGSGKSTIARLIAGLYQPWNGQILLDGTERHLIPRPILNNSLRIVDQQIFMFEGTIHDNLAMWDQHIPLEQITQAAKDAHIHLEIAGRPGGYDSEVQENGRNFSGGQRQRLEIARALVTNPSILLLDEATSALDPVTEQIIDDNLRRRGCTCVIVAHRLSTIRDCDEIIVLDAGKVVERGTHDSLWRKNGVYSRLIKSEGAKSEILLDSLMEQLIA